MRQDAREFAFHFTIDCPHLPDAGLQSRPHKGIAHFAEDSLNRSPVYIRVGAVEVAQRLCQAVCDAFHREPNMISPACFRPSNGQSKLEGHIEPRRPRCDTVDLDPREVMDRVFASLNQLKNPIEAPRWARNLQGNAGIQSKRADAGKICEIQILKLRVVGQVEKDLSARSLPSLHASIPSLAS